MTPKRFAKSLFFRSGAIGLYRGARHRSTLTAVMFHRVLPVDDRRFASADRDYTMRLDVFEQCVGWLKRNYNVVRLQDVEEAVLGRGRLPPHALLVTIDDGWEDTARYAVPVLRKAGVPCAVFIATGASANDLTLWKDVAAAVWRAAAGRTSPAFASAQALVAWLATKSEPERRQWLSNAAGAVSAEVRPLMASAAQVRELATAGTGLGGHGATHQPMTDVDDVGAEFAQCAAEFQSLTGRPIRSFSYPHGRFSAATVSCLAAEGVVAQFTSVACLNALAGGRPASSLLGRIDVPEQEIVDSTGRFSDEKLAYWLTMRPVRRSPAPQVGT